MWKCCEPVQPAGIIVGRTTREPNINNGCNPQIHTITENTRASCHFNSRREKKIELFIAEKIASAQRTAFMRGNI